MSSEFCGNDQCTDSTGNHTGRMQGPKWNCAEQLIPGDNRPPRIHIAVHQGIKYDFMQPNATL